MRTQTRVSKNQFGFKHRRLSTIEATLVGFGNERNLNWILQHHYRCGRKQKLAQKHVEKMNSFQFQSIQNRVSIESVWFLSY